MKKLIAFIILYALVAYSFAQEDTLKKRPTQVTFFYPIGTNGVESTQYTNNFSFNVLYGVNGGLNGVEIGGLVNSNLGHVNGMQIAGISNINAAAANGMMVAGISNFVKDTSNSLCFAGISNVIGGSAFGMQVAGIVNTTNGRMLGGQIAGISNIANGDLIGTQIAGINNVTNGNVTGGQIASISNVAKDLKGTQMSLVNRAKVVNGFQLGLINIAEDYEKGVPLGLFSFVKNGYHSIEFAGGESLYGNINFKLGVDRLYTIYKAGYTINQGTSYMSYGLGLGTKVKITEKFDLAFDASTSHIVRQTFSPRLDLLSRLDMSFRFNLGEHLTLFAGPSFNIYGSEHDPDTESSALPVPYSIYTSEWWNGQGETYLWVGLNGGVAINF